MIYTVKSHVAYVVLTDRLDYLDICVSLLAFTYCSPYSCGMIKRLVSIFRKYGKLPDYQIA